MQRVELNIRAGSLKVAVGREVEAMVGRPPDGGLLLASARASGLRIAITSGAKSPPGQGATVAQTVAIEVADHALEVLRHSARWAFGKARGELDPRRSARFSSRFVVREPVFNLRIGVHIHRGIGPERRAGYAYIEAWGSSVSGCLSVEMGELLEGASGMTRVFIVLGRDAVAALSQIVELDPRSVWRSGLGSLIR